MIAVSVSTYINNDIRLSIFKESLQSLLDSNFSGDIIVVDDSSPSTEHLDWLLSKKDKRISILRNRKNLGISYTKNVGIYEAYHRGSEYIFLLDDDVIYLDKDWNKPYISASKTTKLNHFSYAADVRDEGIDVEKNGISLLQYSNINGCLLFLTKELVDNIGYFKKFPHKYGHEHVDYTFRHNKYYNEEFTFDVKDSDKLVTLHKDSLIDSGKSIKVNDNEVIVNSYYVNTDKIFVEFKTK